jgi:hypothetical protein
MKKRIVIITLIGITLLLTGVTFHSCCRNMARPRIELSWRHFVRHLASQQYDVAFRGMSQAYKANHTEADFVQAWSDYDWQFLVTSNRDITAVYIGRLSPAGDRAKAFVTTSQLSLPLPLEDGFTGIHTELVYENGKWMIDDFPFMVEGR